MTEAAVDLRRLRRLLVVEDDRDFAESLVDLLEPLGYSVRIAGNIAEALDSLSVFAAEIALVDVKLGPDDGVRLIPRLKSQRPELVCVLMTAYASLDSAMEAVKTGAQDYLSKPIEPALLARKLEHALAQSDLQQRREREQRLIAMGNLCAGVAHDVNNYLQVMVTELSTIGQVVRTRLPDAVHVMAGLEALEYAANGATTVCRQILAFAKGSAPGTASDASEALRAASPMLEKLLPVGVTLQMRVPDAPLWVVFDAKQLEQLLLNLVVNARHAVGEQGSVWVELSAHADSGAALLKVRDDGAGISAEVLPRIFNPYFSTKPPSEGTGLGLSVVYGMVNAVGGSIQVESQVGRGTCFELRLPLRASEFPPAAEPPAKGLGKLHLLLVDDFEPILRSMEKLFKGRGYQVVCATSAEAALALLDAPGPTFDGLISDVRLPGMSGVDLANEMRRRGLGMPVALISGDTGHIQGVERLGPNFIVLNKPFKLLDLFERFESLCAAARARG